MQFLLSRDSWRPVEVGGGARELQFAVHPAEAIPIDQLEENDPFIVSDFPDDLALGEGLQLEESEETQLCEGPGASLAAVRGASLLKLKPARQSEGQRANGHRKTLRARAGLCLGASSAVLLITLAMTSYARGAGGLPQRLVGLEADSSAVVALRALPSNDSSLAAATNATCTWPSCVPKCLPCEHAVLGKCAWEVLNMGVHCPASAGPIDCHMGRCFCADGFCPASSTHAPKNVSSGNGIASLQTASHCTPKVCLPGTQPPTHEPSTWATFFSALCGSRHVPKDVIAKFANGSIASALFHGDDSQFGTALFFPAVLLFFVGLAVTLEMLIRIECHESKKVKEIMAGHMKVEASRLDASGEIEAFTLLDIDDDAKKLEVEHSVYLEGDDMVQKKIDKFMVDNSLSKDRWVHPMFDKDSRVLTQLPDDREKWPITVVFTPNECEIKIERPSACPMMTLAISTLVLCLTLVMFKAYKDLQSTLSIIDDSMDRAHAEAVIVAKQGHTLNSTAQGFGDILTHINSSCSKSLLLSPFIFSFENSTGPKVRSLMGVVENIGAKLEAGPSMMEEVQSSFNKHRHWLTWGPLLPVALISLLCLGMVLEAVAVEMCDSSTLAFEVDCSLRIATILFAVVIIIVSAVGAFELWVANFLSLLCIDVDENALHAIQSQAGQGELHNVSLHYIVGQGYNPLAEMLQSADEMVFDIGKEYGAIHGMLGFLGKVAMCPVTKFLHVNNLTASARHLLNAVSPLVDNSRVYPYYEEIVRKGMCGTVINALGWILLAQLTIGFLCFPLCVYFTHKFLTRWAIWEWAKEHAAESGVKTCSLTASDIA